MNYLAWLKAYAVQPLEFTVGIAAAYAAALVLLALIVVLSRMRRRRLGKRIAALEDSVRQITGDRERVLLRATRGERVPAGPVGS